MSINDQTSRVLFLPTPADGMSARTDVADFAFVEDESSAVADLCRSRDTVWSHRVDATPNGCLSELHELLRAVERRRRRMSARETVKAREDAKRLLRDGASSSSEAPKTETYRAMKLAGFPFTVILPDTFVASATRGMVECQKCSALVNVEMLVAGHRHRCGKRPW